MNLKQVLTSALGLLVVGYANAQTLSSVPPVQYPAIEVTPAMQAAKNLLVPPTGTVENMNGLPTCNPLAPICTAPGLYYSLTTNANAPQAHQLNPGNQYDCLATTPNPMWYYIRVFNGGDIIMNLTAQMDIDYAIWGPFPDVATAEAICGNYPTPINCSYSASNIEQPTIMGAQSGQIYVLLMSNFANIVQTATLTQIGGTGTMGCDGFSSINGTAWNDANLDCVGNAGDSPMPGLYIQSNLGYAITDTAGQYGIVADSGVHTVQALIPAYLQPLVTPICDTMYTIGFGNTPVDTMGFDFHNDVLECPYLTVDVSSNRRRRCFQNFTTVEYCNEGFADATNVQVYVQLPQYVNFVSADMPYTLDANGAYVFNIGNLAMGQCGTINIVDSVSCLPGIMGTVQCIEAWITPANSCVEAADTINPNDPWDQSSMMVTGYCIGDSVAQFVIHNTGDPVDGDMEGPSEYRIYVDGVLVYTGTFQIAGGADYIIQVPATGGTIRLEADQRPNHPGYSHPNDVVQGCGDATNTNALADWLAFNAQPTDDADVAIEEDCMPILDSYDPNDKQVSPGGVGEDHIVLPNTVLDYTIRFQNTGNAYAYRVIIRDTLSLDFDLSSLQLGVASHAYDFYLTGTTQPIMVFDHKNINLPDSFSNPLGSQGFVKYKLAPRSTTPLGTVIENRAGIYFDFNDPIITNTAWVTVDLIPVGPTIDVTIVSNTTNTIAPQSLDVQVYPNPTSGQLFLDLRQIVAEGSLGIYTLNGQLLNQQTLDNQRYTSLDMSDLPAGIYMLQVISQDQVAVLKVVKR